MTHTSLAFIGGGNMAGAIFGGLVRSGWPAAAITVVEPVAEQRERIVLATPGLRVLAAADASLSAAQTVVWAVKPQSFQEAAAPCVAFVGQALHLSVMAGIRSEALAQAVGSQRIVRAMPNTPALIGLGIAGLFARTAVSAADRTAVEAVLAPTGQFVWFEREEQLDAVTAISASGPAYVFYFLEAMIDAAEQMGLTREQGRLLAQATFAGATALVAQSDESPATLRERVTSKGGTTFAALESMRGDGVAAAIVKAVKAAEQRARELGGSS